MSEGSGFVLFIGVPAGGAGSGKGKPLRPLFPKPQESEHEMKRRNSTSQATGLRIREIYLEGRVAFPDEVTCLVLRHAIPDPDFAFDKSISCLLPGRIW